MVINKIKQSADNAVFLDASMPIVPTAILLLLITGVVLFTVKKGVPVVFLIIVGFLFFLGSIAVYRWWRNYFEKGGTEIFSVDRQGVVFTYTLSPGRKRYNWKDIEKVVYTTSFSVNMARMSKAVAHGGMVFFLRKTPGSSNTYRPFKEDPEAAYFLMPSPEGDRLLFCVVVSQRIVKDAFECLNRFSGRTFSERFKAIVVDFNEKRLRLTV